ncbi:MAG: hypothetical protein DWQ06_14375 [Calditrichaeota bacterium]|nr:MAG: hypothetical protein DWQ06_14375 [Calditrichota bacterium]
MKEFAPLEEFVNRGFILLKDCKPGIALNTFQEGLEQYPSSPELINGIGMANLEIEEFGMAKLAFEKGLEIEAENPDMQIGLGISLLNFNRIDAAMTLFENSMLNFDEEDETKAEYATSIGRALCNYEYFLQALRFFDLAIEIDPMNPDANFGIGVCRHVLGMLFAKDHLWNAISEVDEFYEAFSFLGNIYYEEGDVKKAMSLFDQIPIEFNWDVVTLKRMVRTKRKERLNIEDLEEKLSLVLESSKNAKEIISLMKKG